MAPAPAATATATAAGPPGCNTTSAYSVLLNDPELSTLKDAVSLINLAGVLQNPNVKFTVSGAPLGRRARPSPAALRSVDVADAPKSLQQSAW